MDDPCDVCGAAQTMTPLVEAGLPGVGAVWIRRCAGCGLRQVRPRLSPAAVEALYGADYFDSAASHGFAGYARQRQRYERDAFFLARELQRFAPTGRFLEVGSALGFLLASLGPRTRWRVEGVEVSAFGAWYARDRFGVTVHEGTLEGAGFAPERFDYVLQKDLLEHVTHPRRHLEETRRIMRPGARLRIVTPHGEADLRPLQRAAVVARPGEVPVLGQGHLTFFSRAQLLRLLDDVGFRVLRVQVIGPRRGLRALGVLPGRGSRARVAARETLTARIPAAGCEDRGGAGSCPAAGGGPDEKPRAADLPGACAPSARAHADGHAAGPRATAAGRPAVNGLAADRRETLSRPGAAADGPDELREALAARIDDEIARCHRRVRAWRPYFHYRRVAQRLGAGVAAFTGGQDFDVLAQRR